MSLVLKPPIKSGYRPPAAIWRLSRFLPIAQAGKQGDDVHTCHARLGAPYATSLGLGWSITGCANRRLSVRLHASARHSREPWENLNVRRPEGFLRDMSLKGP